ncbi:MAG: UDP-glucose 4-epimerase GalE [Betaproteobacteria bacterium]|nr:UDP-glucose 4-epimerase GalE [Betaproteobacteria bacterium]
MSGETPVAGKSILVTGGAGYIGSHTCVELLNAGFDVTIVDNLCNSKAVVVDRLERICGVRPGFVEGDVRDLPFLRRLLAAGQFDAVMHFAGLKAVGESVALPLAYYDNNVGGSIALLRAMRENGVRTLVFSSSATVYGDARRVPVREDFPLGATNPYGRCKLMVEEVLGDLAKAEAGWNLACLRYFNPAGAHGSGLIGEDPNGVPNNLMHFVAQVAGGRREKLSVFGDDYPTPDGTGVRDYIHVVDLARGHVAALNYFCGAGGLLTVNLGTGRGVSVLEMVAAFAKASGREIPYEIRPRRAGDIASCYADPSLAGQLLGWRAERGIDTMCADAWLWQTMNPHGYRESPTPT